MSQKKFERLICGHPREVVTAYGPDGRQLFAPLEGEADRVALPSSGEVDLRGAVLVHGHPDLRALSDRDIETSARRQVGSCVAVLPDRTALRLIVSDHRDWPYEEMMDRNDLAWRRVQASLRGTRDLDAIHQAVMVEQRREFAEIGVVLERYGIDP